MYGLPYAGASVSATTITEIWTTTGIKNPGGNVIRSIIYPNPVKSESTILMSTAENKQFENLNLLVYDILGNVVRKQLIPDFTGSITLPFRKDELSTGMYYW